MSMLADLTATTRVPLLRSLTSLLARPSTLLEADGPTTAPSLQEAAWHHHA